MKKHICWVLLTLVSMDAWAARNDAPAADSISKKSLSKIAFGSCAEEYKPQPILNTVVKHQPDLFVYLGDNIYGDTFNMGEFKAKYDELGKKPEFNLLWHTMPVIATWDDHDFGWNDIGKEYPYKQESKALFLDFWREPNKSERRKREGIYASYTFGETGQRTQVILLDMRTFRDNLKPWKDPEDRDPTQFYYPMDYAPHDSTAPTLLGENQWKWLEKMLKQPADLRIIGSSTQFGITHNGYEAWANFPHEQNRMAKLIKSTKAEGLLFISGDVHYAEVSKFENEHTYPLYDFTASGITSTWTFATENLNRIHGPMMENHFGLLEIDWTASDPSVQFSAIDVDGKRVLQHSLQLSELKF